MRTFKCNNEKKITIKKEIVKWENTVYVNKFEEKRIEMFNVNV